MADSVARAVMETVSKPVAIDEPIKELLWSLASIDVKTGMQLEVVIWADRSRVISKCAVRLDQAGEDTLVTVPQAARLFHDIRGLRTIDIDKFTLPEPAVIAGEGDDSESVEEQSVSGSGDSEAAEEAVGPSPKPHPPKASRVRTPGSAGAHAKPKRSAAKSFHEAAIVRVELEEVLTEAGLDSIMQGLGKAGITSSHTLRLHTLAELEESLQRPTAYGKKC